MSAPDDCEMESEFEARLSAVPRRALAPELREVILARACPQAEARDLHRWWSGAPRPLVVSIAACWAVSLGLDFAVPNTRPAVERSSSAAGVDRTEKDPYPSEMFVAWVERKHFIAEPEQSFELY